MLNPLYHAYADKIFNCLGFCCCRNNSNLVCFCLYKFTQLFCHVTNICHLNEMKIISEFIDHSARSFVCGY